jgi:hypothetical protein
VKVYVFQLGATESMRSDCGLAYRLRVVIQVSIRVESVGDEKDDFLGGIYFSSCTMILSVFNIL